MKSINLAEKLALFDEQFQPRAVGQFNGHDLMVVKVKGPFVWRSDRALGVCRHPVAERARAL